MMNNFREARVQCLGSGGFHEMAYVEWGVVDNPTVLVCVHGLTRCGRDFDDLARALSADYRVVCPDIVGRGRSGWLKDPRGYGVAQYCSDMMVLLGRLQAVTVHWVGTSMGGLIGMALAALDQTPISRLVLNDVGPVVSATALARIGEYLGKAPRCDSIDQAEAMVRLVGAPFGALTDAQWRHLTVHVVRLAADGKFEFCYDPGIAIPFQELVAGSGGKDIDLWPTFDAIRCPTLVLRGAESDLLTPQTATAMTQRGPRPQVVVFAGIGHAPMLLDAAQIAPVRDFLFAR